MKLSGTDILACLAQNRLQITPPPATDMIRGASVDLRLDNKFRVFSANRGSHIAHIDLGASKAEISRVIDETMSDEIVIEGDNSFYLHPGELALGVTRECVTLPADLCGILNGRSSLARLGLMVHATAHFIDPGWSGQIVLEFFNCGRYPLGLKPGMAVCALAFEPLSSPATVSYDQRNNAKYLGQHGAAASRLHEDDRGE